MSTEEAAVSAAQGGLAGAALGPWGIAIGAGAGLLQGLLSAKARKEAEERRRKQELEQMAFQSQMQAAKTQQEGEKGAFAQFMQGYQSSLLR